MATRGHLGGLALATPQAVRVLDAVGKAWIIVETVGVGQVEVEIAGHADTTVVVVNPGWGDAVQAAKAGLLEIADVFVVNKADRPGADRRPCAISRACSSCRPAHGWRPPIVRTVATTGDGRRRAVRRDRRAPRAPRVERRGRDAPARAAARRAARRSSPSSCSTRRGALCSGRAVRRARRRGRGAHDAIRTPRPTRCSLTERDRAPARARCSTTPRTGGSRRPTAWSTWCRRRRAAVRRARRRSPATSCSPPTSTAAEVARARAARRLLGPDVAGVRCSGSPSGSAREPATLDALLVRDRRPARARRPGCSAVDDLDASARRTRVAVPRRHRSVFATDDDAGVLDRRPRASAAGGRSATRSTPERARRGLGRRLVARRARARARGRAGVGAGRAGQRGVAARRRSPPASCRSAPRCCSRRRTRAIGSGAMADDLVLTEPHDGGVALLRLNHPPMNPLSQRAARRAARRRRAQLAADAVGEGGRRRRQREGVRGRRRHHRVRRPGRGARDRPTRSAPRSTRSPRSRGR